MCNLTDAIEKFVEAINAHENQYTEFTHMLKIDAKKELEQEISKIKDSK